jgi:hypothetical protein
VVGGTFDHQEQQVTLRREPGRAGVALSGSQKGPQRRAELRDRDDLFCGQLCSDAPS